MAKIIAMRWTEKWMWCWCASCARRATGIRHRLDRRTGWTYLGDYAGKVAGSTEYIEDEKETHSG